MEGLAQVNWKRIICFDQFSFPMACSQRNKNTCSQRLISSHLAEDIVIDYYD